MGFCRAGARKWGLRETEKLTQVQVAAKLGKPQSYVSKVESGERRIDPVELARFAEIYGCRVGHFLEGGE